MLGRRADGDVELKDNEWAKAAILQKQYWLCVLYDCTAAHPRLLRVQDTFQKLLVKAKGSVVVDERCVFGAAES